MKQIDSIAGKCYIATAPNGGTVTDEAGRTLATVEAGEQKAVWGTDGKLYLSDDDGKLVLATFNYALAVAGLLGGGADKLPAGYTRVDFLESTGSQYINTEYSGGCTAKFRYAVLEASAYNSASSCWGQPGALNNSRGSVWAATNTGYLNLYACFNVGDAYVNGQFCDVTHELCDNNSIIIALTVNGVRKQAGASGTYNPTSYKLFNRSNNQARERLGYCTISSSGKLVRDFLPALAPNGEPCMFDLVTREPFRNAGSGQFIAGMTLSQVRALRLPAGGGELTLSLPHEASIDRLAQAALERARENGWTLTLQYAEAEVPAGYRKLEYLESTGTQYVDTEYTPTQDDEFNLVFFIGAGAYVAYPLMSAGDGNNQLVFVVQRDASSLKNTTFLYLRYFCNVAARATINLFQKNKLLTNKDGKIFINETYVGQSLPLGEVNTSLLLFKRVSKSDFCRGRIYSFSISRAGEMQVDYVPCIAPDGKLGMYNKVDGTLKENAGSGSFIAGLATVDDVRKLWLPETGGELTVSVPSDTPDSAVAQLRSNNPTWQIAIQYRTDNNENQL